MPKVTFNNKKSIFFNDVKKSVEDYFNQQRIQKTGNWKLFWKTATLVPLALGIYLILLTVHLPAIVSITLCLLLGLVLAGVGFNIMHDACHGSYSNKKWINNILGLSLNALGGNAFIWKFKHNIIHHTYTNVDGVDDDIAKSPLMRMCSTQKWIPAHKFQHIYIVFLYAISSMYWVFFTDYNKYFSKRIVSTPLQKMEFKEHFIFWTSKLLYLFFYVALPVFVLGWIPWLIGFTCLHVAMGFTLSIVFQLAHVVEHAEFEVLSSDSMTIENEWAVHQIKTTSNFAPRNKMISWYVGGLNFQIEHHLFPKISHVHYPAISKIVEQKCAKFNLPYNQFPKMSEAIASHFKMIKQLGKKPALVNLN